MATNALKEGALDCAEVEPNDRPTGFGYHTIFCRPETYNEMIRFYQVFLGGSAIAVEHELPASLIAEDDRDVVLLIKRPDLPHFSQRRTGFLHVAWSYNSLAELMYVYRHATQNGIKAVELLNSPILMQFYFRDPEGNFIEVSIDGHDTPEETQMHMRAADGIRVPGKIDDWKYDAETVLRMLEAGVSDHDILNNASYHALAASGRY